MPRKVKEKTKELNSTEKVKKVQEIKKSVKNNNTNKSTPKNKSITKATKTTESTKVTKTAKSTKSAKSNKTTKTTKATTRTSTKTKAKSAVKTNIEVAPIIATEYYDLPFRYNQTIVRILAQTPNILFIYWDISDEDRNSYIQKYGEKFFENTRPYLIITNKTMNYTFEVEINDFANSWYLHIHDADCEYKVELVRKFISNSQGGILYITSSNGLEMPNDHILFDKLGSSVFFRNTKTNITEAKNISSISFLQKIGKVYNIYDLYKEIYQDEFISDGFGLNLSSSSSSKFN